MSASERCVPWSKVLAPTPRTSVPTVKLGRQMLTTGQRAHRPRVERHSEDWSPKRPIVREFDDSWIGNPGISLLNPRCPAKKQPSDRGPSFEMSRARCIPLQCAIDSGVAVTSRWTSRHLTIATGSTVNVSMLGFLPELGHQISTHWAVGSRTGAVFRRSSLAIAPRFLWECLSSQTVNPSPAPATSHPACGFPALGAPVCLVPRVMWPIVLGRLSRLTIDGACSC